MTGREIVGSGRNGGNCKIEGELIVKELINENKKMKSKEWNIDKIRLTEEDTYMLSVKVMTFFHFPLFTFLLFIFIGVGSSRCEAQTLLTVGFEITPPDAVNYPTITAALEMVNTMEGRYEIWVKRGRYSEDELYIYSNVEIYGGFSGREKRRSQRNSSAELTILDGGLKHRIASVSGLIDGFQIENGREKEYGGGIRLLGGIVQNCIIQNNEAGKWGGGIYCEGYVNVVQNSIVRYNVCKLDTTVIIGRWKGKGNSLKKF